MGTENIDKNTFINDSSQNQQNRSDSSTASVAATPTSSAIPASGSDLVVVPLTIDEHNVIDGARKVMEIIRPTWNSENINFKLFTDGITNKLVGCFYTASLNNNIQPTSSIATTSATTTSPNFAQQCSSQECVDSQSNDVVLVRVYGNKTDLLIDRKAELRNIQLLHQHGFAPNVYGVFANGLAYGYIPGVTLTLKSVIDPNIWPLVATHMANMHRLNISLGAGDETVSSQQQQQQAQPIPVLWNKMQRFLDLVPETFSDPEKHQRLKRQFLPVKQIRDEFTELYKRLELLNSPVVFCHNDLLLGNVIYTESENRVSFIDFEYADHNFQAYDIGNHFTEFAGIDDIDYTRYPSRDFQYEWLRLYLQTYNGTDDVSEADVNRLYVQVNAFALASHFFWTVWGLIQAEHSSIDFDFILFAQTRYSEYLIKKEEFLSLANEL